MEQKRVCSQIFEYDSWNHSYPRALKWLKVDASKLEVVDIHFYVSIILQGIEKPLFIKTFISALLIQYFFSALSHPNAPPPHSWFTRLGGRLLVLATNEAFSVRYFFYKILNFPSSLRRLMKDRGSSSRPSCMLAEIFKNTVSPNMVRKWSVV